MTEFFVGDFGTGMSQTIYDRVRKSTEEQKHTFVIVPDREVLTTERKLLSDLPPSAELTLEVLGFSRLYNRVCRSYGGIEYAYVKKPIRAVMMWETVRRLQEVGSFEGFPNDGNRVAALADKFLTFIDDCKRDGISSHDLLALADKAVSHRALHAKLSDLTLVYSEFETLVASKYSDASDDMQKLLEKLKKHPFFAGCDVYIDSFSTFSGIQQEIIRQIFLTADSVCVTVPLSKTRSDAQEFANIRESFRRLNENAKEAGKTKITEFTDIVRPKRSSLRYFCENVWNFEAPAFEEEADGLSLLTADSPMEECRAAAGYVRHLTLDLHLRARDIGIVMRDADRYRGILEPALSESGIPFYSSEQYELFSQPLIKFILGILRVKAGNFRSEDVISVLKTYLLPISPEEIDCFEEYVHTWKIHGDELSKGVWTRNADGYSDRVSKRAKFVLKSANNVRKAFVDAVAPFFADLEQQKNAADQVRALYRFLTDNKIDEVLVSRAEKEKTAGRSAAAEACLLVWKRTLSDLASLGEGLGDAEWNVDEFSEALRILFLNSEASTLPTSVDEVSVGVLPNARMDSPRALIILGANDGVFPKSSERSSLFSKEETAVFTTVAGGAIGLTDEEGDTEEMMTVKKTLSLPSEYLRISCPNASASGDVLHPSVLIQRALDLFKNIKVKKENLLDFEEELPSAASVAANYFRYPEEYRADCLNSVLTDIPGAKELTKKSEPRLSVEHQTVSEKLAKELFPNGVTLSHSAMDTLRGCPFSYYCRYILNLREDKNGYFDSNTVGSLIHAVLESVLRRVAENGGVVPDDETFRRWELEAIDFQLSLRKANNIPGSVDEHLFDRILVVSEILLRNMLEEIAHSLFKPSAFELSLDGKEGRPSPLTVTLDGGEKVYINGTIDRVDLYKKDDGTVFVRVVDYKSYMKDFKLDEIANGDNIQMLLYLFAYCANSPKKKAGVNYFVVSAEAQSFDGFLSKDEIMDEITTSFRRFGVLLNDPDVINAVNSDDNTRFFPHGTVSFSKQGMKTGVNCLSEEAFDSLQVQVENVVKKVVDGVRSGICGTEPILKGKYDPCRFCKMLPICRKQKRLSAKREDSDDQN